MIDILLKDLFRYEGDNCHNFRVKIKYIFLFLVIPIHSSLEKVKQDA